MLSRTRIFSADSSPALVACEPVCADCGAGNSDEGGNFGMDYIFTGTLSYVDRTVAGARRSEA